ncbi:GNAT family protein [Pseudogracilibacillus sp. SE30717A]|uniref:GNAT family N-acetyltransferase n=1 Tax=Pseudogracilibacillus sp. SE30717A TaxID=3098293 RepID=UPI00300DFDC0
MILGENVYLRLMEEKDVPYKVRWINNSNIRSTLNFEYPISEIGTKKWLNNASGNPNRKDFFVCVKETHEPIGFGGLLNIDYKNSKAESYMGIGEEKFHGKGYGYDIRKLILNYAFNELSLNKVYSYVWEKNAPMLNLNKKVGFQVEGLLREDILSHGELRNRYIMSILKSEFLNEK